ncbi:cation channel sperm-associated auxiliary subunit epsilon-like [Watersipora subatra]|uniref:cation channel sperm-associated auxiliary subunit epsilon-like n=1 Tax=Watersipora subatra TaxID=2589382 RepID=UPI00355BC511
MYIRQLCTQVYLLDKLEVSHFWVFLVYKQDRQNALDLIFTDTHNVIEFTKDTEKIYRDGVTSENITVRFVYQETSRAASIVHKSLTNSSVAVIELRPRRSNLLCPAPNSAVAYMSVGCPSGRHIRVQLPDGDNCTEKANPMYNNGYTIPAGRWADLITNKISKEDKFVKIPEGAYLCQVCCCMYLPVPGLLLQEPTRARSAVAEIGCPIFVGNEEPFRPVLEMYDYNKFVKLVKADFVLWEVNGRVDYAYTHNAEQMLCLRSAQSWSKMRELSNYSLPPEELWGADNYMSCYHLDEDDEYITEEEHHLKYEVLNYTSPNRITFNHDYDSLLVFKVKVVDSQSSFCDLSATFAVTIKGIVVPRDLKDIALANYAVLTAIVLSLIATYVWFHRRTIDRQIPMQETKAESFPAVGYIKT